MSNDALVQTINTGQDPRGLPEFSAIREEINKASHPSQPELNWRLVESLALAIFKTNGVDLHTATYYTLARTRLQGLAGFCEGVELLAALISREWDKFWPQAPQARTEMLDWFNSRTGNVLRQQLSFSAADLPMMYRAERALQVISDKLQQVELKRIPRVENLLYFVQNSRKRQEEQQKGNTFPDTESSVAVRTLVYAPTPPASPDTENRDQLPHPENIRVEVHQNTAPVPASVIKTHTAAKGFIAGMLFSGLVATLFWWQQIWPLKQKVGQLYDTTQGAASLWQMDPVLSGYEPLLKQVLNIPATQLLETGEKLTQTAEKSWPESHQQQEVTRMWSDTLKSRAENSPQLKGWQQARQELRAFADLMMTRETEKQGFTLSYIKTVIWQTERSLNQEVPLEYLLTQYQEAAAHQQNTEAQEKQINERVDALLSRWLLLKKQNNTMPGNH
ncbi:hypothetical protein HAY47_004427 [Salmonella enterica]|nr:hypothetical protein [Salmonella enterica]ECI4153147.1 hypothetical protein [Salmonella enterica subsp. salamae]HCM1853079.1 type VI secretion system ImpA family N-terminal domain-containing protein [Salmonella enterica subsp. salamae serovar 42:z29:-]EAU0241715.1 hypothetical protein [Salmonella enterica]EAX3604119.1 hypothetical protein [Salmonella enterica]